MANDDKTLFMRLMEDLGVKDPVYKILDFLVVHDFDYPMVDIARQSKVGYSTLKKIWPYWEQEGIVIKTREAGNAKLYRLNENHPYIAEFKKYYWNVTKQITDHNFEKRGWDKSIEAQV